MKKRKCQHCNKEFVVNKYHKFNCNDCKYRMIDIPSEEEKIWHKKYQKEYYKKNKEKHLELTRKWRKDNLAEYKRYQLKYFKNNRSKINKLMNQSYYKNKEKHFARVYTNGQRKRILEIIGNKCKICGSIEIETHHEEYFKIPQSNKEFSKGLIKRIKKNIIPYCRKHHRQYEKSLLSISSS